MRLNSRIKDLQPSATLAINEQCKALIREGKTVYKMGLGQSPFPVPGRLVQALQENAHQKDYLPVGGLHPLRESISDFHQRRDGLQSQAEDILIGPGSKELLFLLQLASDSKLFLPTPCWVSYGPQAQICNREIITLPSDFDSGWKIQPEQIEAACRQNLREGSGILILNYPNNPFGDTYSREELQEIAKLARKYQLLLLADEIYGELHFSGTHVSLSQFYPEGTILASGLSKWAGAGGWRLGYFVFPQELEPFRKAMAAIASETYTSVNAPVQYAAIQAYEPCDELKTYLTDSRRILKSLGLWCTKHLRNSGIRLHEPTGGFYLLLDFQQCPIARRFSNSTELCKSLLCETGVAILPGSDFLRPPEELTARLAFVDFNGAEALQACRQEHSDSLLSDSFLHTYCPAMLEGIKKLADWCRR